MNVNFPDPPGEENDESSGPGGGGGEPTDGAPTYGDSLTDTELREAVKEYAEWAIDHYDPLNDVDLDDVSVEISHKMERAAGKAGGTKQDGRVTDQFIRFAWQAYEKWGWGDEWERAIRHELIHIRQYQEKASGDHGAGFKRMAEQVGAPVHCPQFAEYEYLLYCTECEGFVGGRYQRSKTVKNPEEYRTSCCSAPLRSERASDSDRYSQAERLMERFSDGENG